jgi:hypothetical protein
MKQQIRVPEDIPPQMIHNYEQPIPVTQICAWLVVMTMFIYSFFYYVSKQVLS